MIRLLVRLVIAFVSNAVGLLVAAAVLDGVSLNATGFIVAVVVFTVVFALMQPFLISTLRRAQVRSSGALPSSQRSCR